MTKNYTSLVGVKWTNESMLEIHKAIWLKYREKLLNSKKLTEEQKRERYFSAHKWIYLISKLCLNKELAIKKE
jgi:hypothetical protein